MGCLTGKTKTQKYTDMPLWFDPLGPASIDSSGRQTFVPSGGVEQRQRIFGALTDMSPVLQAQTQRLQDLAPRATGPEYQLGLNTLANLASGRQLIPDEVYDALRAGRSAALSAAETQAARNAAAMTRMGLGYSTARQAADRAALSSLLQGWQASAANALAQAAMQGRQMQQAAALALPEYLAAPLSYQTQLTAALLSPYLTQAQIVAALAGGGQIVAPQSQVVQTKKPGLLDYIGAGLDIASKAIGLGS